MAPSPVSCGFMAAFSGGSAWAMAREIASGYVVLTDRLIVRLARPELDKLGFELDRKMREVRGGQPSLEDIEALRLRNRQLQRLTSARRILNEVRRKKRV